MRVTFVYRYLTLGGVEVVLAHRLAALPPLGIQPTLWFLSDGPGRKLWPLGQAGVRVGGLPDLRQHLEDNEPHLISIIDTPEALTIANSLARPPGVVLEVHTPYRENRVYLRWPECRLVQAVLVPSCHQGQVVEREMPRPPRLLVVPNPIGPAFEAPLDDADPWESAPIVAWVGRLDYLKDWRGFLALVARLVRLVPQVEAWVIGAGSVDEEKQFERSSERSELEGRVRWLRGVPPSVMPRLYDAVRGSGGVVVSTSRSESFGMAIAEAMARGCAVVAPHEAPFSEYIAHEREGLLYRGRHWDEAALRVSQLLSNAGERDLIGRHARQRILRDHNSRDASGVLAGALEHIHAEAGH